MIQATSEEMIALSQLPVKPEAIGIHAWCTNWVKWRGHEHSECDCGQTLLTFLAADQRRLYLLLGEHMAWMPTYGHPIEDRNGVAWIEVVDSPRDWIMDLHRSPATEER